MKNLQNSIIIVCAGKATRSGLPYNKIFYPLGKKSVLDTVIDEFVPYGRIILVAATADFEVLKNLYPVHTVVLGGATRTDSVRAGLNAAKGSELVAIHDAARPFVTSDIIKRAFASAREAGSGIAATKSTDAAVLLENHANITENQKITHLKKENLYCLQTPQCFRYSEIAVAYQKVKGSYADDSEVYALAGFSPRLVEGSYANKKLTSSLDFADCTAFSAVGSGFDVHELVSGRKLVLGGLTIPFEKGLLGHSDTDVLLHAVTDAILSAAGEPDIGVLFPDNDDKYKNLNSAFFLAEALNRLDEANKIIASLSCVLIAQKPKLAPFVPLIKQNLSDLLRIDAAKVNISATTTEFLGIIGQARAIAASAAVLCVDK